MAVVKLSTKCERLHNELIERNLRTNDSKESLMLEEAMILLTQAGVFLQAAERFKEKRA
jgi:hypothetical protein